MPKLIRKRLKTTLTALVLAVGAGSALASTFELEDLLSTDRSAPRQAAPVEDVGLTQPLAQLLQRAQDHFLQNRFDDAESIASELTQKAPDSPAGWHLLGMILANQQRYNASLAALEKASDLYTANAEPLIVQGDIMMLLGRAEDARALFLKAVERDPNNWRGTEMAARLAEDAGDMVEAQRLFEQVLATAPGKRLFPRLRLAQIHMNADRTDIASGLLEAYVRRYPDNVRGLAALGHAQLAAARPSDAAKSFARAAALVPNSASLLLLQGRAHLANSDAEAALASFERARSLEPAAPGVYLELGNYHGALRDYARALDTYQKGLTFDVNEARLLRGARLAAFRLNRETEALEFATRAARTAQATSDDQFWLGFLREQTGQTKAAAEAYEAALSLNPANWVAANNLSVLVLNEDPVRAVDLAKTAVAAAPGSPDVQATLGWASFHTGDYATAQDIYAELAAADEPKAHHLYRYGRILIENGARAAGRAQIEAALALDPAFEDAETARAILQD